MAQYLPLARAWLFPNHYSLHNSYSALTRNRTHFVINLYCIIILYSIIHRHFLDGTEAVIQSILHGNCGNRAYFLIFTIIIALWQSNLPSVSISLSLLDRINSGISMLKFQSTLGAADTAHFNQLEHTRLITNAWSKHQSLASQGSVQNITFRRKNIS